MKTKCTNLDKMKGVPDGIRTWPVKGCKISAERLNVENWLKNYFFCLFRAAYLEVPRVGVESEL